MHIKKPRKCLNMNPKVEFYFTKHTRWQEELKQLRNIIFECGLNEELKWGVPCYKFQGSNIVLIHVFKDYCALLFFKGVLLNDASKILIQQTKNVQSARQIRFTNVDEVIQMKLIVKAYIYEAIEVEKRGLKVIFKTTSEFKVPEEFKKILIDTPALKVAFDALTPGRQKAYLLYFSQPKQSSTRVARAEKSLKQIMNGKGLKE